jgi:hypothetical protein
MSYENLLNDLETLQKSYAAEEDDKKIQAAAAAATADDGAKKKDGDEEELDEDGNPIAKPVAKKDGDEDGAPMAKSFIVTTADGEKHEAIDGTEMIKALQANIEDSKSDLTKSLTFLVGIIKSQGSLIKSLNDKVDVMANQGAGRKSITAPTIAMMKSLKNDQPLDAQGFMIKANAAFDSGRITGKDLTVCDVALRMGSALDQNLVNKILGE